MLKEDLLEQVLDPENTRAAYAVVKRNGGKAGIDGIETEQLGAHLHAHWVGIKAKLYEGGYKPAPVKPVRIDKPGGGERLLGIPTTVDRVIQQALQQVLSGILDKTFSDASYGYRPGRSAHDAIRQAQYYVVEEQRDWVVELDIEQFFDRIDHDLLMRDLSYQVRDKRVLKLVGKYLRAGVLEDGHVTRSAKGTPQGSPLSPILANLYLDRLDKELESRGVAFVRYADDLTLYARSERSAHRIMTNIVPWIEKHLKLQVNARKSRVRRPHEGNFLGFVIHPDGQIGISEKGIMRYQARVRTIWDVQVSMSGTERIKTWRDYARGWSNYFCLCEWRYPIRDLSGWTRRHMRKYFWLRWHNYKGRRNAIGRLGATAKQLRLASSSRGAWRVSLALNSTLTNARLKHWGLLTPIDLMVAT